MESQAWKRKLLISNFIHFAVRFRHIRSLWQTDSDIYQINSEVGEFYSDEQSLFCCSVTGVNDLQCLGPKMSKEDSTVYNLKVEVLV